MAADDLVYGATEASTFHNGVRVRVHVDQPWERTDPFVKARPDLFKGLPDDKKIGRTVKKTPAKKTAAAKK